MQIDREAAKESMYDTFIATLINFPLNFILISIAFAFEMTAFITTVFCTSVLFIVAAIRKYHVRTYFAGKQRATTQES